MTVEHLDVLIVGAGLSGIGAACHLQREHPDKSIAILEARDSVGGTWDLFRYPGVRSDSDMFTLGYAFRPWTSPQSIADGQSILAYVRDTAREYGVDRLIRFRHRVVSVAWSSETARWTVTGHRAPGGADGRPGWAGEQDAATSEPLTLTCSWLSVCSGYYRYDQGFTPSWPGSDDFAGALVHPQHWPEDLDYSDKQVVVIGSGATAVTLVPAMAERAAHVTMVQRSPSYIAAVPRDDRLGERVRRLLPAGAAYRLIRWKNILVGIGVFQLSRRRPEVMRSLLRNKAVEQLPVGFDVDTHLAPTYDPWDQRLCAAPDGDFFAAVRSGRATIVTDRVERLTRTGVLLASGQELAADVLVTATGLNLQLLGGIRLTVDGRLVDPGQTVAYKGLMLSGVPNLNVTIGYPNASWTLKADLVARYVCRLLGYLDASGYDVVTPLEPDLGRRSELTPMLNLRAGYILRAAAQLPKQGRSSPWRVQQNYLVDALLLGRGPVRDGVRFGHGPPTDAPLRGTDAVVPVR